MTGMTGRALRKGWAGVPACAAGDGGPTGEGECADCLAKDEGAEVGMAFKL